MSDLMAAEKILTVVGTASAIVGTFIVSPHIGTALGSRSRQRLQTAAEVTRRAVDRILRRPRVASVSGVTVAAVGAAATTEIAQPIVVVNGPPSTWEAAVAALQERVSGLQRQVDEVSAEARRATADLRAEVVRSRTDLLTEIESLRAALRAAEENAQELDVRGFVWLTVGVVLTGVPWFLTAWPAPVDVFVIGASILFVGRGVVVARQVRHAAKALPLGGGTTPG